MLGAQPVRQGGDARGAHLPRRGPARARRLQRQLRAGRRPVRHAPARGQLQGACTTDAVKNTVNAFAKERAEAGPRAGVLCPGPSPSTSSTDVEQVRRARVDASRATPWAPAHPRWRPTSARLRAQRLARAHGLRGRGRRGRPLGRVEASPGWSYSKRRTRSSPDFYVGPVHDLEADGRPRPRHPGVRPVGARASGRVGGPGLDSGFQPGVARP